jgi:hypothetical protein
MRSDNVKSSYRYKHPKRKRKILRKKTNRKNKKKKLFDEQMSKKVK